MAESKAIRWWRREVRRLSGDKRPSDSLRARLKRARKKLAQLIKRHRRQNATKISQRGLDLIANFEGFRARAYKDPVGIWTIGYGHTGHAARSGNIVSREEAQRLLRDDARSAERSVRNSVRRPLTQNQFDALVSFTFNVGGGALASSTLLKKLNAGQYSAVPRELQRWTKGGGRELPGLVTRRKAEAALWSR